MDRPIFPPDIDARIDKITKDVQSIKDWINHISEKNPEFILTLIGYKKTRELDSTINHLKELKELHNELYVLDQDKWAKKRDDHIRGEE